MYPQHPRPLISPPQRFPHNGPPPRDEFRSSYGDFIDRLQPPVAGHDLRDVRFRGDYVGTLGPQQGLLNERGGNRNDIPSLMSEVRGPVDTWRAREVGYHHGGPPPQDRHIAYMDNGFGFRNGPYPPQPQRHGGGGDGGWRNEVPPRFMDRPRSRSPIDNRGYGNRRDQPNDRRRSSPPRSSNPSRKQLVADRRNGPQKRDDPVVDRKLVESTERRKSVKELKDEEIEKAAQKQIAMMADLEAKAKEKEKNEKEESSKAAERSPPSVNKPSTSTSSVVPANANLKTSETPAAVEIQSHPNAKPEIDNNTIKTNESMKTDATKTNTESQSKPIIISNAKFEDVHLFHLKDGKAPKVANPKSDHARIHGAPASKPPYSEESWFKQYQNRTSQLKASTSAQRPVGPLLSRPPYNPPPTSAAVPRNGPVFPPAVPPSMGHPARSRGPYMGEPSYPRESAPAPLMAYPVSRGVPVGPPVSRNGSDPYGPPAAKEYPHIYRDDLYGTAPAPPRHNSDHPSLQRTGLESYEMGTGREVLDPTAFVEELSDMGDDWNEVVALLKESPKPQKRPAQGGYPTPERPRKTGLLDAPPVASVPAEKAFFRNELPSTQPRFSSAPRYPPTTGIPPATSRAAPPVDRSIPPQARIAPAAPIPSSSRAPLLSHADSHGPREGWRHESDRRGPPRDWRDHPEYRDSPAGPPGPPPPGWQSEHHPRGRPYQY